MNAMAYFLYVNDYFVLILLIKMLSVCLFGSARESIIYVFFFWLRLFKASVDS